MERTEKALYVLIEYLPPARPMKEGNRNKVSFFFREGELTDNETHLSTPEGVSYE